MTTATENSDNKHTITGDGPQEWRIDNDKDGKPFHTVDENGNDVYFGEDGKPAEVRDKDGNTFSRIGEDSIIGIEGIGQVTFKKGSESFLRDDGCYVAFSYDPPSDPYIIDENGKEIDPKSKKAKKLIKEAREAMKKADEVSNNCYDCIKRSWEIIDEFAKIKEQSESNTKDELRNQRTVSDKKLDRQTSQLATDTQETVHERTIKDKEGKEYINYTSSEPSIITDNNGKQYVTYSNLPRSKER